jgi:hypothetical protein
MKTITFNTGRSYAKNGQVITATLHEDNVVTFFDHSRMIDGTISFDPEIETFNAAMVTQCYDCGYHKSSKRSFEDGMTRNGANSFTVNESAILAASK